MQGEESAPGEVGAGGNQPRDDGVADGVLGGHDENTSCSACRYGPVGHGLASGYSSGDVEGGRALRLPGGAVEEGDLAVGNPARPQPFDSPGSDVVGAERGHRRHHHLGGELLPVDGLGHAVRPLG